MLENLQCSHSISNNNSFLRPH